MKKLFMLVMANLFAVGVATAAPANCEAHAVSKDGKPLAGAAKNAFMKKCEREQVDTQCAAKAMDKNGKPLAGAAKNSFMKKCTAGN